MHMQHLLQPFQVENLIAEQCPVKPHTHSFFELIYILEGNGSYMINDCWYPYVKDDVFVIVPENGHHTLVETTTSFLFIRFNSKFMDMDEGSLGGRKRNAWLDKVEYIFLHQQRLPDTSDPQTKLFLRMLCTSILEESIRDSAGDDDLLHQLIKTMLMVMVKRIDLATTPVMSPGRSGIRKILDYIHQNIRVPQMLRIEAIADHVNMSKNYVSEYFRKFYSKSPQQYITDYKFQLIEDRLRRSDVRIGEIAHEFGFSGESHLATAFRKHKGVSPLRYRKMSSKVPVE